MCDIISATRNVIMRDNISVRHNIKEVGLHTTVHAPVEGHSGGVRWQRRASSRQLSGNRTVFGSISTAAVIRRLTAWLGTVWARIWPLIT